MFYKFLVYIWRIWFYILAICITLLLLPFIILSVISEKTYAAFFFFARIWSFVIFYGMGMRFKQVNQYKPDASKSYIIIANHTSMLDIMLMLLVMKQNPFVFVGKAELAKIPIFGFIYKRTCILVNRGDLKSKKEVYDAANHKIKRGLSICIFPEGGVNDDKTVLLDPFKDGAFRLALEHKLPILPLTFYGLKEFFPFIKDQGKPGKVLVQVNEPIETADLDMNQKKQLNHACYSLIYNQILGFKKQKN